MEIRDYIEESMRKLVCRMPYIQLTKSNISDKNIGELEDTIQKKLPDSIKAYLMSYSLSVPIVTGRMLGDFSKTYCEENGRWRPLKTDEDVAITTLQVNLKAIGHGLENFRELNTMFIKTNYICIGIYNEVYYVLLDTRNGGVVRVDTERVHTGMEEGTEEDIERFSLPFFKSFEDLLLCFFDGNLYDIDEMVFVKE